MGGVSIPIRLYLIVHAEAALGKHLESSADICTKRNNIVIGQRDRVVPGNLVIINTSAVHGCTVLDKDCLLRVSFDRRMEVWFKYIDFGVKLHACMVAGHDSTVDPTIICSGNEVLRVTLGCSPDLDGVIVLVQLDRTSGWEDAICERGKGYACCEGGVSRCRLLLVSGREREREKVYFRVKGHGKDEWQADTHGSVWQGF